MEDKSIRTWKFCCVEFSAVKVIKRIPFSSKILLFCEKNGGHVVSRYCCCREWIPFSFPKNLILKKDPY